jgi:hypothetical protein
MCLDPGPSKYLKAMSEKLALDDAWLTRGGRRACDGRWNSRAMAVRKGRQVRNLATLKGSGRSLIAELEAPGSRERWEHFCRYLSINHLCLYFLILL